MTTNNRTPASPCGWGCYLSPLKCPVTISTLKWTSRRKQNEREKNKSGLHKCPPVGNDSECPGKNSAHQQRPHSRVFILCSGMVDHTNHVSGGPPGWESLSTQGSGYFTRGWSTHPARLCRLKLIFLLTQNLSHLSKKVDIATRFHLLN